MLSKIRQYLAKPVTYGVIIPLTTLFSLQGISYAGQKKDPAPYFDQGPLEEPPPFDMQSSTEPEKSERQLRLEDLHREFPTQDTVDSKLDEADPEIEKHKRGTRLGIGIALYGGFNFISLNAIDKADAVFTSLINGVLAFFGIGYWAFSKSKVMEYKTLKDDLEILKECLEKGTTDFSQLEPENKK